MLWLWPLLLCCVQGCFWFDRLWNANCCCNIHVLVPSSDSLCCPSSSRAGVCRPTGWCHAALLLHPTTC
jgi:hypothetical protein